MDMAKMSTKTGDYKQVICVPKLTEHRKWMLSHRLSATAPYPVPSVIEVADET